METGFFLEMDSDYPDALHNMHKTVEWLQAKSKTDSNIKYDYQMGLLDQAGERRVNTLKFAQTLPAQQN